MRNGKIRVFEGDEIGPDALMASACLPIALDQVRKAGTVKPGGLVMLVAFGSGFVWGSALLRL